MEEVFKKGAKFRFVEKGKRRKEDMYVAFGQAESGRYLTVLFIYKNKTKEALILSARDMAKKERKQYGKK